MTRRIPIFEFNEELSPKKHQVYKSLVEGVSEAIKNDKEEIKFTTNDNHTNYPKPPTILHTGTIKDGSDIPKKTLLVHEVFHGTDSQGNGFVSENFGFYIKIGNFKKNKFQGQGNANKLC